MEEKGFQKIDLTSTEDTITPSPMESRNARKKRKFRINFKNKKVLTYGGIALVVILLVTLFVGFRAFAVYKQAMKVKAQASIAFTQLKQQDIALAREELAKTQTEITGLKKEMTGLSFLKFVPLISGYYNDADHMVKASSFGVNAGIITADALIPYVDVLGLKGKGTFTGGTAQDRIRTAVKTMGKVVPQIDKIEKELIQAKGEIDQVNPGHYPAIGKLKAVREQLTQLQNITDGAVVAVGQGKPLIKALPTLLGEKEGKKYLLLFQNDAELRPTGGFLTYYAIFRVEEGDIKVDSSSDIYNLDNSISSHPAPSPIIRKYFPSVKQAFIRDSNLSPDFVESMKSFNELYELSSQKNEVDGIIAINTHFFVNIIRILGEVEASGLKFTADNDPRCDCPQVVYTLEDEISRPVNYVKTNRKGLVGDLMLATLDKALKSSPKLYWGQLFQQFIVDANEKNILFYLYDKDAQNGIEALNWAGKVREFTGDYQYINDANFGGQKSNLFVDKTLAIDYSVGKNGEIKKKVTIEYKNPKPHSDCNLERGGLCLNATLRNYQRMLVPKGSVLDSSKGSQVKVETFEDLGKTVFDAFFTVNPQGKATMTYEYSLPFKVTEKELPLYIQKQPGVDSMPTVITVNGKKVQEFDLRSDMQLKLSGF
ncbi:MAG: DUF4012 domain-containing protein [Candidatus Levybacteria bacterium]|nr:DUF4012 domain-containing protein [Candidatus Levybacteria bacterium]